MARGVSVAKKEHWRFSLPLSGRVVVGSGASSVGALALLDTDQPTCCLRRIEALMANVLANQLAEDLSLRDFARRVEKGY